MTSSHSHDVIVSNASQIRWKEADLELHDFHGFDPFLAACNPNRLVVLEPVEAALAFDAHAKVRRLQGGVVN